MQRVRDGLNYIGAERIGVAQYYSGPCCFNFTVRASRQATLQARIKNANLIIRTRVPFLAGPASGRGRSALTFYLKGLLGFLRQ